MLVVVSKIKGLIRDKASFNTAQSAVLALSNHTAKVTERAAEHAAEDHRKTVMERDIHKAIADVARGE